MNAIRKLASYATLLGMITATACAARHFEAYKKGDAFFEKSDVNCSVKRVRGGLQVQATQTEGLPFYVRGWYHLRTGEVRGMEYKGLPGSEREQRTRASGILFTCSDIPNQ